MCWDAEPPQLDERFYRRARKEHPCYACAETIRPGDKYHFTKDLHEGVFGRFKHCLRCWAMVEALWEHGAEAVDYSLHCHDLWEDAIGDLPDSVAYLAFITPDEAQRELFIGEMK